ncbi:putative isoflavone reductase family protein [Diplodia seriata]|uniref:Putative isoflavone reductase family protein n=1 Tax=Diplodia seriata TaxID=420778 RepID=A0A0G2EPC0_9PEZI|nr:putative isoflavone reductase family protein [Diplodia seriata]
MPLRAKMASPIKNVVLVGAGGNLGPSVLKEFLAASPPLNITVLTRPESKSTFPPTVKVIQTDYTAPSLTTALTNANADALISLVGTPGFAAQKTLIDAAIAAGVQRFIPSEYGSDTSNPSVVSLVPFLAAKRQVVEYLVSKESATFSWSALITGPFFDWGLKVGFLGFDLQGRKARREVLKALEKATPGETWEVVEDVDVGERVQATNEKLARGDFGTATDLILAATYGREKELGKFPELWNDVLGLPEGDLDRTVREVVEGKRP